MKIFVVEDDIVCVKELQTMIKDLGFELMGAAVNVEDCSRFLKYKTPDLVIAKIDIGIDGLSFLLNNDKVQSIPTIFTTGANGSKELAKQGHINNCTTLVKPFDKDTLLSAIIYLKTKQNDTNLARLILAKKKLINRPIKQDDVKEISAILKEDATLTSFNLSDREKYILKKYCLELSSFGEIGDSLKISPQRVRILYKKAFVKVKSSLSNLAIKEDKKATVKFKADKPTLENSLPMGFSEKKRRKNIIYIDDVMELKTKPRNILKANQINTLQNLSSYTRKELLLFNGFGSNSVKSIERILGLYGLQLKH